MSDLGAYASLLYTAALTGGMKIVYTIVLAFALMASVHGLRTRAIILLDMQEARRRHHGSASCLMTPFVLIASLVTLVSYASETDATSGKTMSPEVVALLVLRAPAACGLPPRC